MSRTDTPNEIELNRQYWRGIYSSYINDISTLGRDYVLINKQKIVIKTTTLSPIERMIEQEPEKYASALVVHIKIHRPIV
jgi:hypothetical protein